MKNQKSKKPVWYTAVCSSAVFVLFRMNSGPCSKKTILSGATERLWPAARSGGRAASFRTCGAAALWPALLRCEQSVVRHGADTGRHSLRGGRTAPALVSLRCRAGDVVRRGQRRQPRPESGNPTPRLKGRPGTASLPTLGAPLPPARCNPCQPRSFFSLLRGAVSRFAVCVAHRFGCV